MRDSALERNKAYLAGLAQRYRDTPTDHLPDLRAALRRRGAFLAIIGALLLAIAVIVLASTSEDSVALLGFLFLIAGTGCLTFGIIMRLAKGAPSRDELAAAIAEHGMNTGNGTTPPAPNGRSQKAPPTPRAAKGLAMLAGGAAIVALNVTFLGPSAVYICLWIAGVAFFIGGIAEIIGSMSGSASTAKPPTEPE